MALAAEPSMNYLILIMTDIRARIPTRNRIPGGELTLEGSTSWQVRDNRVWEAA